MLEPCSILPTRCKSHISPCLTNGILAGVFRSTCCIMGCPLFLLNRKHLNILHYRSKCGIVFLAVQHEPCHIRQTQRYIFVSLLSRRCNCSACNEMHVFNLVFGLMSTGISISISKRERIGGCAWENNTLAPKTPMGDTIRILWTPNTAIQANTLVSYRCQPLLNRARTKNIPKASIERTTN